MASYRIHRGARIGAELRRIAADQTDRALAELGSEGPHEAIHQVRKRCKKVRALLRLVRAANEPLYDQENAAYRDAARRVSDLRDTTGVIEAVDLIAEHHPALVDTDRVAPIRDALARQRDEVSQDRLDESISGVVVDLRAARERIADWHVPDEGFDALAGGFARTYGRARDAMATVADDPTTEGFHEWRKRVKYHRYHVRLLQDCWPRPMKARHKELHDLSDLVGADHDLAELRARLHATPERFGDTVVVGEFTALLDRRRAQLQFDARRLGARLFVESADDIVGRVRRYWEVWSDERDEPDLLPAEAVAAYAPTPPAVPS